MAPQTTHSQSQMDKAAKSIEHAAGVIVRIQQKLQASHGQLMGNWQGQAARTFSLVYKQFDNEFGRVLRDLNVIHEKLVDTRMNYAAMEQRAEDDIRRLGGIINT